MSFNGFLRVPDAAICVLAAMFLNAACIPSDSRDAAAAEDADASSSSLPMTGRRLETLTVPSSCVDPEQVTMSDPPPGKPARPAALRVNVLLPEGYDGQRRFPILYLLHGLGGAYDYWLDDSDGE